MMRMRLLRSAHFCEKHQACLNGLSQADFVREQGALGERRIECEECGINLVRVKIDLGTRNRTCELFQAVGWAAFGQLVGKIFCVIGRDHLGKR